jgi:AcrR family transcriptional regulator
MTKSLKTQGKEDRIIDTAQKLFGIYGVEKVSMNEIAIELRLSKASLYYYFPDKESLYFAVLEKEQSVFHSRVIEVIMKYDDPEKMLSEYAILRLEHFRRLLNLSRLRLEVFADLKPVLGEKLKIFRDKEIDTIKRILEKGVRTGIFSMMDVSGIACLFLDLLRGLRVSHISGRRMMVIEQPEYDRLLEQTNSFTGIFIRGLKGR